MKPNDKQHVTTSHNIILIEKARKDLEDDCYEIVYLLSDAIRRLNKFIHDTTHVKQHIDSSTFKDTRIQADQLIQQCQKLQNAITNRQKELKAGIYSVQTLAEIRELIHSTREFLRTHQTMIGAIVTATDWQSPSYAHAMHSQAGRQEGMIWATINDYKRDVHEDAFVYERAFVKEYVDNWIKLPIFAYATSSGMAAFTTILNFLLLQKKVSDAILVGTSIWFQNKLLLDQAYGNKIIYVAETDTQKILNLIETKQPSVLVFDSLTNSPEVLCPELDTIIPYLVAHAKKETYLVIDNTCLTLALQPMKYLFGRRSKVRLIVFESLNKYHQFGADRVTGGIIWSYGGDTIRLSDFRRHLGTNIPDVSVCSLPTPNKTMLTKRLARHSRNAHIIASALQTWVEKHPANPFAAISFPGLTNNPSYAWTKNMPFWGSYFTFIWKARYTSVPVYQRFIKTVMNEAKKRKLDIVAGSTFGLNTTRIYLTALHSRPSQPFIRVAVGAEDRLIIEEITQMFMGVVTNFTP